MKGSLDELLGLVVDALIVALPMAICGFVGFLIGRGSASKAYQAKLDQINHVRDRT